MNLVNKKNYLTLFQWCEVLVVIALTIYFAVIDKGSPLWYLLVDALASICGIFCVVLCAAGKKSQYYWGFINIIAYIVIAYCSKYYGEIILNGLYYLPTQFIGMYFWKKHLDNNTKNVKCKKMSLLQVILFAVCSIACIFIYHLILMLLGSRQAWLNSTTDTFALVANALMVLRFREQWILWIAVDLITVMLWIIAGDWIQTTMWAVFLVNAFYGFIKWTKMNKSNLINE